MKHIHVCQGSYLDSTQVQGSVPDMLQYGITGEGSKHTKDVAMGRLSVIDVYIATVSSI